jgi:hypothetical protein
VGTCAYGLHFHALDGAHGSPEGRALLEASERVFRSGVLSGSLWAVHLLFFPDATRLVQWLAARMPDRALRELTEARNTILDVSRSLIRHWHAVKEAGAAAGVTAAPAPAAGGEAEAEGKAPEGKAPEKPRAIGIEPGSFLGLLLGNSRRSFDDDTAVAQSNTFILGERAVAAGPAHLSIAPRLHVPGGPGLTLAGPFSHLPSLPPQPATRRPPTRWPTPSGPSPPTRACRLGAGGAKRNGARQAAALPPPASRDGLVLTLPAPMLLTRRAGARAGGGRRIRPGPRRDVRRPGGGALPLHRGDHEGGDAAVSTGRAQGRQFAGAPRAQARTCPSTPAGHFPNSPLAFADAQPSPASPFPQIPRRHHDPQGGQQARGLRAAAGRRRAARRDDPHRHLLPAPRRGRVAGGGGVPARALHAGEGRAWAHDGPAGCGTPCFLQRQGRYELEQALTAALPSPAPPRRPRRRAPRSPRACRWRSRSRPSALARGCASATASRSRRRRSRSCASSSASPSTSSRAWSHCARRTTSRYPPRTACAAASRSAREARSRRRRAPHPRHFQAPPLQGF